MPASSRIRVKYTTVPFGSLPKGAFFCKDNPLDRPDATFMVLSPAEGAAVILESGERTEFRGDYMVYRLGTGTVITLEVR